MRDDGEMSPSDRDAEALPAGPALDQAMQRVLRQECEAAGFAPSYIESWCGRIKPWSTNIMLTMSLIDEVRYMYHYTQIELSCDQHGWTCLIEGTTTASEYWYCEASGRTLPEAFCRAWLQTLPEAEPVQDDPIEGSHAS